MDNQVKDKANVAFIRARVALMKSSPFWAHLVMKLDLEWDESLEAGPSGTDGKRMYIHPVKFTEFEKAEQQSILVHEAWHCAAGHLWRRGNRDPLLWNLAGDIQIANNMEADGFTLLRSQEEFFASIGIKRGDYVGLGTEETYEKLAKEQQQGSQGKGKGKGQSGGCDKHWNGNGCYHEPESAQEQSAGEREWRSNVVAAGQLAGNAPGSWRELVKAAMPKPPFSLRLHEFLQRGLGGDADWAHLNRRYIHEGMYLPTDTKPVMGRLVWVTDTSGSMASEQLALAFGYFRAFRDEHPCVADLICCDHGVASHETYDEQTELPASFEAGGRGGTSFNAPFELLREKHIEAKLIVYVTDGYGSCTVADPGCPTMWVVVRGDSKFKPPFGEVVLAKD